MPSDKSSPFADRNSFFSATQGVNRRDFIRAAAVCTTGALLGGAEDSLQAKTRGLPKPNKSGIEHIVLVTMGVTSVSSANKKLTSLRDFRFARDSARIALHVSNHDDVTPSLSRHHLQDRIRAHG